MEVNLGRPIVTNGTLLHSCVEVHELIELSFGVVSGVRQEVGVLDGVPVSKGKGDFSWIQCRISLTEMYSICA